MQATQRDRMEAVHARTFARLPGDDEVDLSRARRYRHRPVRSARMAYHDPFFGSVFCDAFR